MSEKAIRQSHTGDQTVSLVRWSGPWDSSDPDANFKEEVAAYGLLEPLDTITRLSESLDIPVGALVRYVLAKWATGGSEGMLHIGGTSVQRMHNACQIAEDEDTDEARLLAYEEIRQMVQWLHLPIEDPTIYD